MVRCIRGAIYDVAVDLRKNSPTFGRYVSVELSEENKFMVYVPKGFAHGFLVLSENAEVIYKVDNVYAPGYETGLIWNDADINVEWPIKKPTVSQKDRNLLTLKELIEKDDIFRR